MHIQIVTVDTSEGTRNWGEETFSTADAVQAMQERGYEPDGERAGGRHLREELQGQLCFKKLCGPTWGGHTASGEPIIRYETWEAYEILST